MFDQEVRYKIFNILQINPELSQRDLAKKLGISLGKANFCVKALIDKGLIKSKRFQNSKNKIAYTYLLTPKGIEEKAKLAVQFLKIRMQEYEMIKKEIKQLQIEVGDQTENKFHSESEKIISVN